MELEVGYVYDEIGWHANNVFSGAVIDNRFDGQSKCILRLLLLVGC